MPLDQAASGTRLKRAKDAASQAETACQSWRRAGRLLAQVRRGAVRKLLTTPRTAARMQGNYGQGCNHVTAVGFEPTPLRTGA